MRRIPRATFARARTTVILRHYQSICPGGGEFIVTEAELKSLHYRVALVGRQVASARSCTLPVPHSRLRDPVQTCRVGHARFEGLARSATAALRSSLRILLRTACPRYACRAPSPRSSNPSSRLSVPMTVSSTRSVVSAISRAQRGKQPEAHRRRRACAAQTGHSVPPRRRPGPDREDRSSTQNPPARLP